MEWNNGADIENQVTVYRTRGGAFFKVIEWEESSKDKYGDWQTVAKVHFEPISHEELTKLVAETDNLEIVDNAVLDDPPEAEAEAKPGATIYVRVTDTLKHRLDAAAKAEGRSLNAYVTRCVERCLLKDVLPTEHEAAQIRDADLQDKLDRIVAPLRGR
jgi:predicted HicB family RNase H-like nuclease